MKHIKNFFKGIVLGIATIIPGVSGGTMAIILKIYNNLIDSINNFFKDFKNNIIFLGVIALGGICGFLGFKNIIVYGLDNFKPITIYLFLGIICGGLPILLKSSKIEKVKSFDVILFLIGVITIILTAFCKGTIVNLASNDGFINMIFMLIAGIFTAIALILPGVSGSFFLLTIGLYEFTMNALKFENFNFSYIIPFAIGTFIGVLITAKIIGKLMKKHERSTFIVILGFVIGSIIVLIIDKENIPHNIDILFCVISFIIGYLITFVINGISKKFEVKKINKTT